MTGDSVPALIEFSTERLRLRQWNAHDRVPFAALNADPHVMEYFPSVLDHAASDAMADRIETGIRERGWGLWAAELKSTGEFIGFVGLSIPLAPFPYLPCVEIGWRLARHFWGHGYASEGANAALDVGFGQLGLEEILSFTALSNARSRAVMARIGMTDHGETFDHPRVAEAHPLRAHCLYRIAREQWLMRSEFGQ